MQAAYLSGQQGAAPHVQLKEYLTLGLLRRAHAKALWDAVESAELNALCDGAGTQMEVVIDENHLTHQCDHCVFRKLSCRLV